MNALRPLDEAKLVVVGNEAVGKTSLIRCEDDRSIYEWLEIIAQRGGDSPVIVVVNKSDSDVPQRQLDEAGLRRTYPVIVGFVRTSCNAGAAAAASISGLRAQIAATLSESARLEHVRDPIPRSWLRVKDAIAELASGCAKATPRLLRTSASPTPTNNEQPSRSCTTWAWWWRMASAAMRLPSGERSRSSTPTG